MNIKYYRPAKDGTHTFSPYRDFSLVDSSTIVEMRPFDSEYINSFKYDLYDFTKEEDKTRIFFISEYAKRKFFLDCNVKKTTMVHTVKYVLENQKSTNIKYMTMRKMYYQMF